MATAAVAATTMTAAAMAAAAVTSTAVTAAAVAAAAMAAAAVASAPAKATAAATEAAAAAAVTAVIAAVTVTAIIEIAAVVQGAPDDAADDRQWKTRAAAVVTISNLFDLLIRARCLRPGQAHGSGRRRQGGEKSGGCGERSHANETHFDLLASDGTRYESVFKRSGSRFA
jgi:hypothetical protein